MPATFTGPRRSRLPHMTLLALLPMMMLPTAPVEAQRTPRGLREVREPVRAGFWGMLGGGVGGQGLKFAGDQRFGEILYKPTFTLRMGGTVGPNLRLGGEASAWINPQSGGAEEAGAVMLIGQIYPVSTAGLFLKAGAGLGFNGFDTFDGYSAYDYGFATSLGLGAELRMGKHIFLVPSVDYTWHFYEYRDPSSYRMRVVSFSLSLLFQN